MTSNGWRPGRWAPHPERERPTDWSGGQTRRSGGADRPLLRSPWPPAAAATTALWQRIYASDTIVLLRAVKTAQRLGFTLVEIEEILRLSASKARSSNPLQKRMRDKVLEIDGKIADLYAIRSRLADALHAGCDSLTNCSCPACPLFVERGKENTQYGQG
jgi:DNA-binding transcriptional MerR regulator